MANNPKVYIEVAVVFSNDGRMLPLSLAWEDGQRFTIDRILDVRTAAAQKAGGQGLRYTVRIKGQQSYLFFERSSDISGEYLGRWFVERRTC